MDIVERLREWKNSPLFNWADLDPSDMEEAADEIERARICDAYNAKSVAWANVEITRLREALQTIANFDLYGDYSNAYEIPKIARAALKEKE